jgi:hypothetical protein
MKQQFLATQFCRIQEKLDGFSVDQHLRVLCFDENITTKQFFFGQYILREGVFVTNLSSDAGFRCNELCELRQISLSLELF